MENFTTCLWFDSKAEEAVNFYTSIFPNSKVGTVTHYDKASSEAAKMPEGAVLTVAFEMNGQKFLALNGGPIFKFTEAVSLMVPCKTQEELDSYWDKLLADGGEVSYCGWLKDKYGFSWQVIPDQLEAWMSDPDPARYSRVMAKVLEMRKLDIAVLEKAYNG